MPQRSTSGSCRSATSFRNPTSAASGRFGGVDSIETIGEPAQAVLRSGVVVVQHDNVTQRGQDSDADRAGCIHVIPLGHEDVARQFTGYPDRVRNLGLCPDERFLAAAARPMTQR